jgi:ATP-dependent DNA helicase RecG
LPNFCKSVSPEKDVTQDVTQDDTQGDTQGDTQDDTQGDTQDGTQEESLDKWIENQIRKNPQITTEELSQLSKKGIATIKRHFAKMPHIRYVGNGYCGHWKVDTNGEG